MRSREQDDASAVVYSPNWGPGIAQRVLALASELVDAEHRQADLQELLERALSVGAEVEHYFGAAVRDARANGVSWNEIARKARVSEATARAKWGPRTLRRKMQHRATLTTTPASPPVGVQQGTAPSDHRQRLGAAVSFLLRLHGEPLQAVAQEAGISASCLSRMLAGQRVPDWPTVFTVVVAAGGRPEEFRLLWEWARGHRQPTRRSAAAALTRFRGALRGLQWAVGRAGEHAPSSGTDDETLTAVLGGELVPDWTTTHRLVQQLGGNPEQVRPLWEDVQYAFLLSHDFFPQLGVRGATDLA
ncbi:helix-turn-helix domain-containing protein [Streptomyces eurythermus]